MRISSVGAFALFSRWRKRQTKGAAIGDFRENRTYMVSPGQPVWMDRDYVRFSDEAYVRNVIAHRCVSLIAQSAASVPWVLNSVSARGARKEIMAHPLMDLLKRPGPAVTRNAFLEQLFSYRLISGNAFVLAIGPEREAPRELHLLRPDRISIVAGKGGMPASYRYSINTQTVNYPVDRINGYSRILHIKCFHPLNDWYGLSPVEAAAYSIDQHNQSAAWNQALLQNGARPSGALIVNNASNMPGHLSEEQYYRMKQQVDEQFSGAANAGRPLLLEGGLEWKEMSLSPKDMDFIEAKNSAARDIALAFGVAPQLLGIPGDNTYSNLQEARLALWEQTVLPLVESTVALFTEWLSPQFGGGLELLANFDGISALALRNQVIWDRVEKATFLTVDEKRAAVGYTPVGVQ